MGKQFEAAQVRVKVPERRWKSKAEVEAWARERLAGGPPSIRASVPQGHPEAGEAATWKHIQRGLFAGQFVVLASDPPGLIVTDTDTRARKFVPSASRSGLILGKTDAEEFIGSIDEERALRDFVKEENERFSKRQQKQAETEGQNWTLSWYHHGRRMRQFTKDHAQVSTERLWQELVKWGKGQDGYSRQTHQDATYFYDWLGDVSDDHPIFRFGTTRIQHILWADRSKRGRDRLLSAILSGPLQGLSDDEFAWIMGKRTKNWPLDESSREELIEIGRRIKSSSQLTDADRERLVQVLKLARQQDSEGTDAVPAMRNSQVQDLN